MQDDQIDPPEPSYEEIVSAAINAGLAQMQSVTEASGLRIQGVVLGVVMVLPTGDTVRRSIVIKPKERAVAVVAELLAASTGLTTSLHGTLVAEVSLLRAALKTHCDQLVDATVTREEQRAQQATVAETSAAAEADREARTDQDAV